MKKLISALFALVAGTSMALATDLPSRRAAPAPAVSTNAFTLSGWYAGGYVGGNFTNSDFAWNSTPVVFGAVVGYEWNPYFRTEATVDNTTRATLTTAQSGQTVFVNGILQYPVGYGITPYVLAGTGFGWNAWGKGDAGFADDARALYNLGAGVRYALTDQFEIDGRYRYINAYSGVKYDNNHVVTLGLNYRF